MRKVSKITAIRKKSLSRLLTKIKISKMVNIKFTGKTISRNETVEGSYHWSADGKHHYILNLEKFMERPHVNGVGAMDEMSLFKTEVHEVHAESVILLMTPSPTTKITRQ